MRKQLLAAALGLALAFTLGCEEKASDKAAADSPKPTAEEAKTEQAQAEAEAKAAAEKATVEFTDAIDVGLLVRSNLGSDVQEIGQRWGSYKELEDGSLSFDGLKVWYYDTRDFRFTLTRKGAGMGGIFVGVDWCNKDYIEKTFGKLMSIEKSENDGVEQWSFQNIPDGWLFRIHLTFDKKGLVNEFNFNGESINLD